MKEKAHPNVRFATNLVCDKDSAENMETPPRIHSDFKLENINFIPSEVVELAGARSQMSEFIVAMCFGYILQFHTTLKVSPKITRKTPGEICKDNRHKQCRSALLENRDRSLDIEVARVEQEADKCNKNTQLQQARSEDSQI